MSIKLKSHSVKLPDPESNQSKPFGTAPVLLTCSEVCEILRISKSTMDRLIRSRRNFPQPRKLHRGRLVRFVAAEVKQYIDSLECAVYDDHAFDPNER